MRALNVDFLVSCIPNGRRPPPVTLQYRDVNCSGVAKGIYWNSESSRSIFVTPT